MGCMFYWGICNSTGVCATLVCDLSVTPSCPKKGGVCNSKVYLTGASSDDAFVKVGCP